MPRQRSSVRFAGAAASPAMTPSWKANAWAGGPAGNTGGEAGDKSPELHGETDDLLDAEWQANEKQLDRDWYDRWGSPVAPAQLSRLVSLHAGLALRECISMRNPPARSFVSSSVSTLLGSTKLPDMVTRREEEGGGVDETHDPFVGDEKLFDKRAVEMQKRLTRRDGSTMSLAQVSSCTGWLRACCSYDHSYAVAHCEPRT